MINFKAVANVIGVLLVVLSGLILTVFPVSLYYASRGGMAILAAAGLTFLVGSTLWYSSKEADKKIGKREGYLIVAFGWFAVALCSMLPYLFSGVLSNVTNALFESASGLTTTGATIFQNIEKIPKDILFWRSLTQWIGGMGIIVLTVAIFPLLGIGGVELFVAEAPGPTSDKIHPQIKETAKRLWLIYVGLTFSLIPLLWISGMSPYDAINHGLTTMATGGFSTKNASIAHFDAPLIQYIILLYMLIAGINYTVIYYSLTGNFKKAWKSEEFKTYLLLVAVLIVLVTGLVYQASGLSLEAAFRASAFQIVSIITTTGFVAADYTAWSPVLTFTFFILLFLGACAGSTSGGIKIIRHLVFFKNSLLEFKRILHPKAVIPIKIDHHIVPSRILTHILVFLLLYLILFVLGSFAMSLILVDFEQPFLTAIGAVATCLGNVGPAIGELGPVDNFAQVPFTGKWLLVFLMFLGRLELFTIIILFTPYFWKVN